MFLIVNIFLCILHHISGGQVQRSNWDLAVTTNDQLVFLFKNGEYLHYLSSFRELKALTFENTQERFIVSEMNQENDTIYFVTLEENHWIKRPIVENLTDDVQSLALDPSTNILYWPDVTHHTINYISYNIPPRKSEIFIKLDKEEPQHLVIHSCKRYMFFTNALVTKPTINKLNLETKEHEVLIDTDLVTPIGITIDYVTNKIYWSDWRLGIYYRIESSNLDGEDRETIISDDYKHPFGLAVDFEYIYWTDVHNNALWRTHKKNTFNKNYAEKLRDFKERPYGLISKYLGFVGTPSCDDIVQLKSEFDRLTQHSGKNLNDEDNDFDSFCSSDDICDEASNEWSRHYTTKELYG